MGFQFSLWFCFEKGEKKLPFFFFFSKEAKSNHIKLPFLWAQYSDAETSARLTEEALQSYYLHSSAWLCAHRLSIKSVWNITDEHKIPLELQKCWKGLVVARVYVWKSNQSCQESPVVFLHQTHHWYQHKHKILCKNIRIAIMV